MNLCAIVLPQNVWTPQLSAFGCLQNAWEVSDCWTRVYRGYPEMAMLTIDDDQQWYFGVLHFQTNLSEHLLDFKLYQPHETQPWLLFRVPRHVWTHKHVKPHSCWWLPHASLLEWSARPSPAAEPLGHLCKLMSSAWQSHPATPFHQ